MSTIPISRSGYEQLRKELDALRQERPEIIQAIRDAREEGDLRENAGYEAARERQSMLEARIIHLETRMANLKIVDLATLSGSRVAFGATVRIEDTESGECKEFTLLGPDEADYNKGSISIHSPVGKALLGKEEGDEVTVEAPRGKIHYEILSVCFAGESV